MDKARAEEEREEAEALEPAAQEQGRAQAQVERALAGPVLVSAALALEQLPIKAGLRSIRRREFLAAQLSPAWVWGKHPDWE